MVGLGSLDKRVEERVKLKKVLLCRLRIRLELDFKIAKWVSNDME